MRCLWWWNSRFIKDQEAMDFLTGSLGVRPSFEGISILGNII